MADVCVCVRLRVLWFYWYELPSMLWMPEKPVRPFIGMKIIVVQKWRLLLSFPPLCCSLFG
jgi:hypothetical protein